MLSLRNDEQIYKYIKDSIMYDIIKIEYIRIYPLRVAMVKAWCAFQETEDAGNADQIEATRLTFTEAAFEYDNAITGSPLAPIYEQNYSIR